jgi:uncharacterized membrane protein YcaP (DUF421 family)
MKFRVLLEQQPKMIIENGIVEGENEWVLFVWF